MTDSPNAVELTVEQAWFIAEEIRAGTFPWALAVTPPAAAKDNRTRFDAAQRDALTRIGVISPDGVINAVVAEWIRIVCFCDEWLEMRYVGPNSSSERLMRGVIARRDRRTVVTLRSAQLITFTAMAIDHPHAVVPALVAGLTSTAPARFPEFSMPARVGARADERLRDGAKVADVLDFLGVPAQARIAVEAVFTGPRTYVEVVAGQRRDGQYTTSEVGVGIVDCPAGRIVVTPRRAPDGEWLSTFAPGTTWAIAVAIETLTATLPDGTWFPTIPMTREFTEARQA